eukprot:TRINITY_DN58846_c0_g1_i1.p1 TRINITY_DN58846_c0_g1~~TRINITY_DN58846_c0_g1_i1.p1  ORF type:complete len:597 (+),score=141.42 TRINITY_DN58846_c0_g1_i1:120-1793(+)
MAELPDLEMSLTHVSVTTEAVAPQQEVYGDRTAGTPPTPTIARTPQGCALEGRDIPNPHPGTPASGETEEMEDLETEGSTASASAGTPTPPIPGPHVTISIPAAAQPSLGSPRALGIRNSSMSGSINSTMPFMASFRRGSAEPPSAGLSTKASFLSITAMPWDSATEAGEASMTPEEWQGSHKKLDDACWPWMWRALLTGPVCFVWVTIKVGRVHDLATIATYAAWSGATLGALLHTLILLEASFLVYAVVAPLPVLLSVMGFFTLGLMFSIFLFHRVRQMSLQMDPGPVNQIYSMPSREHVEQNDPPEGTLSKEECLELFDAVWWRKLLFTSMAGVWCLASAGLFFALVWFLEVPLAILAAWPAAFFAGFYAIRCLCFGYLDLLVTQVNSRPHLPKGNLAWVLRRSRYTLYSSLWVVRRVPEAKSVVADEAWQGPNFRQCDPEFQKLVKVVMLASRRNRMSVEQQQELRQGEPRVGGVVQNPLPVHLGRGGGLPDTEDAAPCEPVFTPRAGAGQPGSSLKYLPPELALNVLGFLATPDLMTEKHLAKSRSFRATIG